MSSGLTTFTKVHVGLSLISILAGLVVVFGLLTAKRLNRWTVLFLLATAATSGTGVLFPFHGVTPALTTGLISLVLVAVAIFARYVRHLAGAWRWVYVITAMIALYLNVVAFVIELFLKVRAVRALPTRSELPFLLAQLVVFVIFVVFTVLAVLRFRKEKT